MDNKYREYMASFVDLINQPDWRDKIDLWELENPERAKLVRNECIESLFPSQNKPYKYYGGNKR